ncbi:MAG: ribose 5-phosphate isomerase B [Bacteroidales bacterium]|nr:ribose 5-phosphate isomerase B [Bacteroidales bacterium]MBK7172113.1 ribose 5-phosphate isomerase B [Bacteroidales bacterium]
MFEKSKTLALGCDHAGYDLKEYLKIKLAENGYSIRDFGTYSLDSMDYPDVAHPVASSVDQGQYSAAILICGSGNGMCITANKYNGVRAALCWNSELARLARAHNDANLLCLPSRFISMEEAFNACMMFLTADFEGGRHLGRVNKIAGLL